MLAFRHQGHPARWPENGTVMSRGGSSRAYVDFAHALADLAGAAVLPHFRRRLAVANKAGAGGQYDPVTAADRAAERAMRAAIARAFPDHGILGEEFAARAGAGVKVVDVPFGAAQVVPSLLGGHVDAVIQLPGALAGLVKSGSVRALVALSAARDPFLPDVPTAQEQGLDVEVAQYRFMTVPKGTPQDVQDTLAEAM